MNIDLSDRRMVRLWLRILDRHWNHPSDSSDYAIVCDPAEPEPGHWEHDA